MPRLIEGSPAIIKLRQKLESGELNGRERPKDVWESENEFKAHSLTAFRARWHKIRAEYGLKGKFFFIRFKMAQY